MPKTIIPRLRIPPTMPTLSLVIVPSIPSYPVQPTVPRTCRPPISGWICRKSEVFAGGWQALKCISMLAAQGPTPNHLIAFGDHVFHRELYFRERTIHHLEKGFHAIAAGRHVGRVLDVIHLDIFMNGRIVVLIPNPLDIVAHDCLVVRHGITP